MATVGSYYYLEMGWLLFFRVVLTASLRLLKTRDGTSLDSPPTRMASLPTAMARVLCSPVYLKHSMHSCSRVSVGCFTSIDSMRAFVL